MPKIIDKCVEASVKTLREFDLSYAEIADHITRQGTPISKKSVCNIINRNGKRREAEARGEKFVETRERKVRTPEFIETVAKRCKGRNPLSQRQVARMSNCAKTSVHRTIHSDLNLKAHKKRKVHRLNEKQKANRRKNCAWLAEQLTDDQLEYCVTLDEGWLYLDECNRPTDFCYLEPSEEMPHDWVIQQHEIFNCEKVMAVPVLTGRGPGPVFFVPSDTKVRSQWFIDKVLKPLCETHLPKLYPGELHKLFVHYDKATSHTAGDTQKFCKKMFRKHGIRFIEPDKMVVKGPDCSPMDFFGFGYLKTKQRLWRAKTLESMRRAIRKEWSLLSRETSLEVMKAWRHRAYLIARENGSWIENVKDLHRRKRVQHL